MLIRRGVVAGLIGCIAINIVDIVFPFNKEAVNNVLGKGNNKDIYKHILATNNGAHTILATANSARRNIVVTKSSKKKFYSRRMLSKIVIRKLPLPIFPFRLKEKKIAKITGYEPSETSCGKYADGKTAIMRNAHELTGVAADPLALPYGTIVYIPTVGYKIVDDTGSALKKSWRVKGQLHIDLRFLTTEEALRWGVKYKEVEIYERSD
ncbi:MAG: 3D domain-containing protein [Planctomycetota bacterium]